MSLHEIATQIGGITDCHHGQAIAITTLPTQRCNEPMVPERFGEMASVMGVDTRGMTSVQASDKWFDEIERMLADLDIRTGHLNEQFGLERKDIEHIVINQYSNDFAREGNPKDYNFEECVKLLKDLL